MKPRKILSILCLAASCSLPPPGLAGDHPAVPAGVTFDAVLALQTAQEPGGVIRYGEAAQQFGELWLPTSGRSASGRPSPGRPAPVVVFIHGGCWSNQYGVDHARPLARSLATAGYAVFNVEYRRVGDAGGGWPGSFQDLRAALQALAREAPPGFDLGRVALVGHSAGGHLALLLASDAVDAPTPGVVLHGVLALAPITDIESYAGGEGSCQRGAVEFMGGPPDALPARYRAANPADRKTHPGTVVLLGSDDPIIPYRLPALESYTLVAEPAGHFDWIHPGTPAWHRLLRELAYLLP